MAIISRRVRILINGVDVSRDVVAGGVHIEMPIDDAVTTTIKFFKLPEIIGDEIRLTLGDGPCNPIASRSPVAQSRRAFWLSKGLLTE
jgi:hypothetical protein